ncbi:MAG TPA: hypothetical protein PKE31_09060 [Pseudomonadota bacterium]|jgi:hypothetical protein|nr:hypothetical protein [Pseudomonadota bacterium]
MRPTEAVRLFGLAVFGSVLSTTLSGFARFPLPDLSVLVALHAGLRHRGGLGNLAPDKASPLGMFAFGAVLGYATDLIEGTPPGLRALSFGFLLLFLHRLSLQLLVSSKAMQSGVAVLALLLFRVLLFVFWALFSGEPRLAWGSLFSLPLQLLLTAAVAPAVGSLLSRLDGVSSRKRHPKALWT